MGRIALLMLGVFSIAFALGTGMGFLIGRAKAPGDGMMDNGGPRAEAGGAEEAAAAPPRPAPRPAPEEPPARTNDAGPALSRFLASIPAEPPIRGEGSIHGTVRLESGEPLPAVLVRANRLHEERPARRRPPGASAEPTLEEKLRQFVLDERRSEANRREAQSGGDGTFTLTGLPQALYWLEASREGYQIQRVERRGAYSARPGDQVDFVARVIVTVPVSVLLPDGSEAAQAQVMAESGGGRGRYDRQAEWTPEHPIIELSPGTYRLQATQGERRELASSTMEVTLEAGAPPPAVTLQLRGHPGIRGKVIIAAGDEFRGFGVHSLRVRPSEPPDLGRLIEEGDRSETDAENSEFLFTNLVPGTYLIGASRGNESGRILVSEAVEVADQMVERDLMLPSLQRSEYLVLHVFGPKGEVPIDVEIETDAYTEDYPAIPSPASFVRRKDGSFLVLHRDIPPRQVGEVHYSITVRTGRYPPKTVEYERSEASEISVQFQDPATLEVTVQGYAPEAHLGTLTVRIEEDTGQQGGGTGGGRISGTSRSRRFRPHFEGETRGLADGLSTFGPLEAGAYLVLLYYRTERENFPITKLPVVVRSGRNAISVRMPRLHSLKVLASGASGKCEFELSPIQGDGPESWSVSGESDAEGQAIFDGLPEGTYRLKRSGGGESGDMIVAIPGQSEVVFQPRKQNAVLLMLVDAESELVRAGFKTGDLIVGANGVMFDDQEAWRALLRQVMKEKSASFLVERGGTTVEIHFDPAKLIEGGVLQPASR